MPARVATAKPFPFQKERRRSKRALLETPVELTWFVSEDACSQEQAATEIVNAHGALLRLKIRHLMPLRFRLRCLSTDKLSWARIVGVGGPELDGLIRIAVELEKADEKFWSPES
ncbi:MAG TPA: hypothetical protein VJA25_10520 [Dehalococcoidia bacterium]|nr:hypothetical protein [Dehalococcoidia bacterium]